MDTAPNRIAIVYCARITVIAFPWIITANLAIAFIAMYRVLIVRFLGVCTHFHYHRYQWCRHYGHRSLEAVPCPYHCRVDGAVIGIIAASLCWHLQSSNRRYWLSVIANLRFMLTLCPVKGIHAGIAIIAAISVPAMSASLRYGSAVIFAEDAAAIYGLINKRHLCRNRVLSFPSSRLLVHKRSLPLLEFVVQDCRHHR
jgi:hypothetical protein